MKTRALLLPLLLLLSSTVRAESFQAWAARAAREEREKDDKNALESYSNALTQWKESDGKAGKAKVLCARAALRDKRGDEEGALEDYSACVAIEKKNAKALVRRGELRLKAGKLSPAIDDFYKAIALDIRYAVAYADRGRAYELQGDKEFAAEDYRHACELGVKAACARADALTPASKRRRKTRGSAHELVVRITEGSVSYSHATKVSAKTQARFSGKPDGGGDLKMVVDASLKPSAGNFELGLLAELDHPNDTGSFQVMTVFAVRPGEAVTALDCGDVRVDLALDAELGPAATAGAESVSGPGANLRLTAETTATDGAKSRCRQILKPGEQSTITYSPKAEDNSHPFLLNANLSPAGGGYELQYQLERTPIKLKGRETLALGLPHPVGDGSASFLLEGPSAGEEESEDSGEAEPSPAPRPARRQAERGTYVPRFSDCLASLQRCVDGGGAFGGCVTKAPACEQKSVKGCCPGACLEAYRKALNNGTSEAAAYRDVFSTDSSCAAPPKSDGDDD